MRAGRQGREGASAAGAARALPLPLCFWVEGWAGPRGRRPGLGKFAERLGEPPRSSSSRQETLAFSRRPVDVDEPPCLETKGGGVEMGGGEHYAGAARASEGIPLLGFPP